MWLKNTPQKNMTVPLAIYIYIESSHKLQNKLKQKREKKINLRQLAAANVPFKRPSKEDLLTQLKICFVIFNGSQQNHKSRWTINQDAEMTHVCLKLKVITCPYPSILCYFFDLIL